MVWYGQPLMALILLAALQTIPPELYEAARVDGAGAWRTFWYITLPHLMPSILFLVLLRTIWMSNHIDMIFVMTGGGPGLQQPHRGGLQLHAHQPVPDRLRVGGRRGAGDHPGGGLGALCAPPRPHRADGVGMHEAAQQRAAHRSGSAIGAAAILIYSLGAAALDASIASITPELKADVIAALADRTAPSTYFPASRRCRTISSCSSNVPFAIYFRNSTIIATGNMLLTLAGREPRRLRLRALPLRRPLLAAGRHAGRLHDPERGAAGAAAGDLPHLRPQQHPSRHDPRRGDAHARRSCCCC